MERSLGLTEAFSIVVGRIIGSGIFRTPGVMMAVVSGSVSLFFSSWIVGGIATILGAMLYAEMVALTPKAGGPYQFLKLAYPPIWTFLRGWAMFFVSETASIAAVALVFSEYGNSLLFTVSGFALTSAGEFAVALSVIWSMTLINLYGVSLSGRFQNIFSFLKIGSLVFIIVATLTSGKASFANFTNSVSLENTNSIPDFIMPYITSLSIMGLSGVVIVSVVVSIFEALRYGFFAYSGWEGSTYIAEEIKNPRKNLPLSLFTGISGVMILYLAINASYLSLIPADQFAIAGKKIATEAMQIALGTAGAFLIAAAVMISTFGNVSTQILVKGRTWYAMARDGMFIRYLGKLHPVYHTPNRALTVQAVWASVLLTASIGGKDHYQTIIDFFSFTSTVFNISTFYAVFVLRKKYPDQPRPYRTPFFTVVLTLVLTIQFLFLSVTLVTRFFPSLMGVLLTLTGIPYYYRTEIRSFFKRRFN